jgi:hypothetical protein
MTTCAVQPCSRLLSLRETGNGPMDVVRLQLRVFPVTLQTPAHGEWGKLLDPVHGLHSSVTALAGNAGKHMLAVIEIDKVGQVVDLHPRNGTLLLHRFLQLFEFNRLLLQNGVAIHADAGWRDAGMTAGARCIVTVEARYFVVAGVDLVRESDRLLGSVVLIDPHALEFPCSTTSSERQPRNTQDYDQPHGESVLLRPKQCPRVMFAEPGSHGIAGCRQRSGSQSDAAMNQPNQQR